VEIGDGAVIPVVLSGVYHTPSTVTTPIRDNITYEKGTVVLVLN
jgi:hypothetical protein